MPLSNTEKRTLYDSIHVDIRDLVDEVKALLREDAPKHRIIDRLNGAKDHIPRKAVRLLSPTPATRK
jgi:hypothetical protein